MDQSPLRIPTILSYSPSKKRIISSIIAFNLSGSNRSNASPANVPNKLALLRKPSANLSKLEAMLSKPTAICSKRELASSCSFLVSRVSSSVEAKPFNCSS